MSVSDPINALRDNAPHVAARLRLLAHGDHLAMLCRMTVGEVSVSERVDLTGLAQSSVAQHLAMLREADAVAARALAQVRH